MQIYPASECTSCATPPPQPSQPDDAIPRCQRWFGPHARADGTGDFEHLDPASVHRRRRRRPLQVAVRVALGPLAARRDRHRRLRISHGVGATPSILGTRIAFDTRSAEPAQPLPQTVRSPDAASAK